MREIHKIRDLQDWVQQEQQAGRQRILVPTMGGLHQGHMSLVDLARQEAGPGDLVALSLFVNPTQFGPSEDLDAYPSTLEKDRLLCEKYGVDLLFMPEAQSMYAEDASITVSESLLSTGLCGQARPGHFDGVCTVVSKLFNLFQPQAAVFGEKDFQQLAVIRRLVRDMNYPIRIINGKIVRETDGLAMSTRNQYLSKEEREQALVLQESLQLAKQALLAGERKAATLRQIIKNHLSTSSLGRIDYVETVHPDSLQALETVSADLLLAIAVFFGNTRLIDNLYWKEED